MSFPICFMDFTRKISHYVPLKNATFPPPLPPPGSNHWKRLISMKAARSMLGSLLCISSYQLQPSSGRMQRRISIHIRKYDAPFPCHVFAAHFRISSTCLLFFFLLWTHAKYRPRKLVNWQTWRLFVPKKIRIFAGKSLFTRMNSKKYKFLLKSERYFWYHLIVREFIYNNSLTDTIRCAYCKIWNLFTFCKNLQNIWWKKTRNMATFKERH